MSYFGEISAKEHYLLRMMLCLAPSFDTKKPVSLYDIVRKEKISQKYLEQLIRPFVEKGWLRSIRGRNGGYLLVKDPREVSLKNILWINESEHAIVECVSENKKSTCFLQTSCLSKHAWSKVQTALEKALDEIRLSELLKQ